MHSISTRATTHGRRRNLKRFGMLATGVVGASGLVAGVAFAQAAPTVTVTPSANQVTVGNQLVETISVTNNNAVPSYLSTLFLGTACSVTPGTAPPPPPNSSNIGLCPAGYNVFTINSVVVDPSSITSGACSNQSAPPTFENLGESNVNVVWSGTTGPLIAPAPAGPCNIIVTMTATGPVPAPSGLPVWFLTNALVIDPATGVGGEAATTNASTPETVLPGAPPVTVTPPVVRHADHDNDRDDRVVRRDRDRDDHPRCGPDSPNNGNGNEGFGNNGNGNIGNCNNGNGNVGDNNNGNGNGNGDRDRDRI